jgi:hypothetical protein
MKKIPVGDTIASAYTFTFGHVGTVIGLIWLPLVVYTLGRFFVVDYYAAHLSQSGDPSAGGQATLVLMGFWFVSLFFTAIIGVSLTRQAIAPRSGSIIAHFAVGPAELNYFLSLLAVFFVMLAVYIAAIVADLALGAVAGAIMGAVGAAAAIGGKIMVYAIVGVIAALDIAALLYVGVRLAFLVAPVTVAEGKIDLIRAWQLTRGNFWRMFAVLAVTFGPIFVVSQLAFAAVVGPGYLVAVATALLTVFQSVVAGGQPPTQVLQHVPDITAKAPLLLGLGFLLAPFSYGLIFAAPAFAYRALVGAPPLSTPDVGPFKAA